MAGDDEDTPPTVFPSAEAAYLARERSEEASAARMRRREEALKRLGRKETSGGGTRLRAPATQVTATAVRLVAARRRSLQPPLAALVGKRRRSWARPIAKGHSSDPGPSRGARACLEHASVDVTDAR